MSAEISIIARAFVEDVSKIPCKSVDSENSYKVEFEGRKFLFGDIPCAQSREGKSRKILLVMHSLHEDVENSFLERLCCYLSVIFSCRVFVMKNSESYGNANVFNGGSDFDVIDEECFLWVFDSGMLESFERTSFFNDKAEIMTREFRNQI